jgi:hypothetical protein
MSSEISTATSADLRSAATADAWAVGAVELSQDDGGLDSGVSNPPRGGHRSDDAAQAADDPFRPDRGHEVGRRLDAVLQRHHHGVRTNEWSKRRGETRHRSGFDADQHDIGDANGRRVVRCGGRCGHEVTRGTADLEPIASDGVQMGSACDERHVLARLGESAAEVSAHRAGPEHDDAR